MTRANVLNQLSAKAAGPGKHFDGQGLMLVKTRKDAGSWKLRMVVDGKRREMGLGRWPDVSIAEARESAAEARARLRTGIDPIQERREAHRRASRMTVAAAIESCFAARQAELKGDGKAGRWMSPLTNHVIPKIGHMPVEGLDQHDLVRVLQPIWHEKADTARKAMNRMSLTLKHAAALGLDVDLQAVLKAQALLGKRRHVVKHQPSLPYKDAPAFYTWLSQKAFVSALALRFLIVTAARTSEVRFASLTEVEEDVWTIPAARTKTNHEHRVPLSSEARRIIEITKRGASHFLFPTSKGKPMSDATMSRFMEREGYNARPHGFRATFRSWAEDCTDATFEVKEACLGHKVDKGVVGAYQRGDRLEQRQHLLQQWSLFLTSPEKPEAER